MILSSSGRENPQRLRGRYFGQEKMGVAKRSLNIDSKMAKLKIFFLVFWHFIIKIFFLYAHIYLANCSNFCYSCNHNKATYPLLYLGKFNRYVYEKLLYL